MVKGEENQLYMKLKERFDCLINIYFVKNVNEKIIHNTNIVDLIFEFGLDKAMKNYNL
jgi:hypothetical protein